MSAENANSSRVLGIKMPQGMRGKSLIVVLCFSVLIVAALGSAVYFYLQYQKSQELLRNPSADSQKEVAQLVSEIGKLIVLPQSETPQVATVSDVNKLKDQAFFSQAKNGDKVLIYTKSQKAILYDPLEKKIVEVGPINLAQATPTAAPTPSELRVALYNGTTTTGLTTKVEKDLKSKMTTVNVVEKSNAAVSTYEKTIVIDTTGKMQQSALQVAGAVRGQIGTLPPGEEKAKNADIIVILGKQ